MATPPKVQIKRTATPNTPPVGLAAGELAVEMGSPTRLWVGVPVAQDPTGKKLLASPDLSYTSAQADAKFVDVAGDTMTGPLTLPGDPTTNNQAATKHYVDSTAIAGGGVTIPPGSVMLFYQAAAPTGWTRVTTQHDKGLRVVGSTPGGISGGTNTFSSVMAQTVVGNHSITADETGVSISSAGTPSIAVYPDGSNGKYVPIGIGQPWGGYGPYDATGGSRTGTPFVQGGSAYLSYTASFSGANTVNVTSTNTSSTAHNHTISMNMQYCDVIICSKD